MQTERITTARAAARILNAGGLVAFPTETVFGLGVDATNRAAIERLFLAKGRPSDNPLIVHIGDKNDWHRAASVLTPHAEALLTAFAPGPITVVLPKHASISPLATAGLDTVGLRIPNHSIASEILREAGVPIAAPSANQSGRPSCTTWKSVIEDLEGRIDAVYCEDSQAIGVESTVVDCCGPVAIVLRPGAITLEQIREVLPDACDLAKSNSTETEQLGHVSLKARSPGLLHPHYQPNAQLRLVDGLPGAEELKGKNVAYCGIGAPSSSQELSLCAFYESVEAYAAGFYEFLREADRQSIKLILVQKAPNHGLGIALLDRQRRAAGE